jgi:hypothetical protein
MTRCDDLDLRAGVDEWVPEGIKGARGGNVEFELPLSPRVGHDDLHPIPVAAPEQRDDDSVGLATRKLAPAFAVPVHGIATSLTCVTVPRAATKYGSNANASFSLAASTHHPIARPSARQDVMADRRRSELARPRKDVNTTPHSSGS